MQDGVSQVATPKDIPNAMDGLDRQIEILAKCVDQVITTIQPIVKPDSPVTGTLKGLESPVQARCAVAERIHMYTARLIELRNKLDYTTGRIQL